MGIPAITVDLDNEQMAGIEPVAARVREAAKAGDPGMMLAQIFNGEMKVFFIAGEQARELQRIMGCPIGKTTRDA